MITTVDAGGSGKLCGGITVGVFGSTKTNFFGSSTGGGVGNTGGINAGGVGVGVEVGSGVAVGVGVVEVVVVGVGEGVALFVAVGVGVGVGEVIP